MLLSGTLLECPPRRSYPSELTDEAWALSLTCLPSPRILPVMTRGLSSLSILVLTALSCSRSAPTPLDAPNGAAPSAAPPPVTSAAAPPALPPPPTSALPGPVQGTLADAHQGTIGPDLPVFLRVSRDPATAELRGTYFYAKVGVDIALRGTLAGDGSFTIEERTAGRMSGTFTGTLGPTGELTGTWRDPGGTKSLPFHLTPIPRRAGAPALIARKQYRARYHVDGYTGDAPPWETISLAAPEVFGLADAKAEAKINARLGRALREDRGAPPVEHYVGDYRSDYAITLNRSGVLSLSFTHVNDCVQCVHPSVGGEAITFSLTTGEEIPFERLFRPGTQDELRAIAEAAYRKKSGDDLDEYILATALEGDYTLSDKGLRLIAFFRLPHVSTGLDPMLELPYSTLAALLDPKSPAAAVWRSP